MCEQVGPASVDVYWAFYWAVLLLFIFSYSDVLGFVLSCFILLLSLRNLFVFSLTRDRKRMDPDGMGRWRTAGSSKGRGIVIRVYYVRGKKQFSRKGEKRKVFAIFFRTCS